MLPEKNTEKSAAAFKLEANQVEIDADLELGPWKTDEGKIDADATPIPSLHIKGNRTKERRLVKMLQPY